MFSSSTVLTLFSFTILLWQLCNCDKVELRCQSQCDNVFCKNGCQVYTKAIQRGCNYPCTNKTSWVETQSFERQLCLEGCQAGLEIYALEKTDLLAPMMVRPVLLRDTQTATSLELKWDSRLQTNITYLLQMKNVDISSDWTIFNRSEVITDQIIQVGHLQPFTTYQFRVLAIITQDVFLESNESVPITTMAEGVPSDSPQLTHLSSPSPSVISVSWKPPIQPNGPLLAYKVKVVPHKQDDRLPSLTKEVPGNVTSWMFSQLQPSASYTLSLSARNIQGEGPVTVREITTPNPGNLSKRETPYLILGADNMVLRQNLISLHAHSETIHKDHNASILITGAQVLYQCETGIFPQGIGVHVDKEVLFVSDSVGKMMRISLRNHSLSLAIYPMMDRPESLTVDWLNNHVYVVNKLEIYRCSVERTECSVVIDGLELTPTDIKVDPINGFLYFTIADERHGLYRVDLADLEDTRKPARKLIIPNQHLSTFTIDYENIQLYFPNDTQNTMLASFFDGSDLSDIRPNVIRPDFHHVVSMVYHQGLFYWTNGHTVLQEEYDQNRQSYRHNTMLFFENHFRGFNMLHPSAQPKPAPKSPPSRLEVIFSDTQAFAQWQKPARLHYQGCGAWSNWQYEVVVVNAQNQTFTNHTQQLYASIQGLSPNTKYWVTVRAFSDEGMGPWSQQFQGETFPQYGVEPMVLLGVNSGITQLSLSGQEVEERNSRTGGAGDITWYNKYIFWTGQADFRGYVFSDLPFSEEFHHIIDASCLAFDWLGKKLYWSNVKQIVIKRCDINGENSELVYPTSAKQLVIDSMSARIYWISTHSVETAFLNGDHPQEYFEVPHFAGQEIHSLALDIESRQIYWLVRGFHSLDLYSAPTVEQANSLLSSSVLKVGRLSSVARRPSIQIFSQRLIWIDADNDLLTADLKGNYSAVVTHNSENVSCMTIVHPSLQPYPATLDEESLVIIPGPIDEMSLDVQGVFNRFTISWSPASEVNYGRVMYKLSLEAPNQQYELIKESTWHELVDIPPYSLFTVSVKAFTYWGYSPWVTKTLRSPMSVPSVPLSPRVYITKRKDAQTSLLSTAADFRWSTPRTLNGVINHHVVYYRHGNQTGPWKSHRIDGSTRHFLLDNLVSNCTYFFQVQSCTMAGCGARTEPKSAVTDAENPVPKLLIASTNGLKLIEVEEGHNKSVTMATGSTVAMTFLAQEEKVFWIDPTNSVVEDCHNQQRQILLLNGTGRDLTVDWVSRTLYMAVEYPTQYSAILAYDLDRQQLREIVHRPYPIVTLLTDPFSSVLFWTEGHEDGDSVIMKSSVSGGDIVSLLSTDNMTVRRRRQVCNCSLQEFHPSPVLALDHSTKGRTKLYFINEDPLSIISTQTNACQCNTRFTATKHDEKGLPPDSLTADHTRIYWSKDKEGVHSIDKSTGLHTVISNHHGVTSIEAYGQHLQPLPGAHCLDPYKDSMSLELLKAANTSLSFHLREPSLHKICQTISLPATKYTLYYSELPSGANLVSCQQQEISCSKLESYENMISIENLKPYTNYVVQLAVSNYYTEYLADEMGPASVYTTMAGVPSPVENVTVSTILPDELSVEFGVPAVPNGPLHHIIYVIKWSRYDEGVLEGHTAPFRGHQDEYILQHSIQGLKPATTYHIKVLAYEESEEYFSESVVVKAVTFAGLGPINCTGVTENSINISWMSPPDDSIHSHNFFIKKYIVDEEMSEGDWRPLRLTGTENSTLYNETFTDLQPGTTYVFKVMVVYRSFSVLSWPADPIFVFETKFVAMHAMPDDKTLAVAITLAVVAVGVFIALAILCFLMRCKRVEKKRRPCHFVNGSRVPDTELAILRELPHTTVQQNNTLYALSIIPTDEDIQALPHFSRDQLNLTKFLGSGAFGEVFEGVAKNILGEESGDTKVAVKTLRKSASEQEKEEFLKEALLMSNFKHEHILSLLGVCLHNDPQFIILELMEAGDLLSFLRNSRPNSDNHSALNLSDLVKICVHVARGCGYLEDMHFVHRDLAARNCLVSSKNPAVMSVKIGDFGLARDIYKNDYYRKEGEGLLPVRWMSPESLVDGVFTTQSDIWAFGVLIWEVITLGQQPYPARTNIEVLHYVRADGRLDRPENCPDEMYELMRNCWSCPQEERPSFMEILQVLERFYEKSLDEESEFCALWNKHMANAYWRVSHGIFFDSSSLYQYPLSLSLLAAKAGGTDNFLFDADVAGDLKVADGSEPTTKRFIPPTRKLFLTKEVGYERPRAANTGEKNPSNSSRGAEAIPPASLEKEMNNNRRSTSPLLSGPESGGSFGYLKPHSGEFHKYLELISELPVLVSNGARPKNNSLIPKDGQPLNQIPKTNYAQISSSNAPSHPQLLSTQPRSNPSKSNDRKPRIHYAKLASFDEEGRVSDSELESCSIDSLENLPLAPSLNNCISIDDSVGLSESTPTQNSPMNHQWTT